MLFTEYRPTKHKAGRKLPSAPTSVTHILANTVQAGSAAFPATAVTSSSQLSAVQLYAWTSSSANASQLWFALFFVFHE